MSREIKFRAWDGESMVPSYVSHGVVIKEGYNILTNPTELSDAMQYTGLLDKSGVEIYEGDLVTLEIDWGSDFSGIMKWFDEMAAFCLHNPAKGEWLGISCKSECYKVIGNIHETPELLEDSA